MPLYNPSLYPSEFTLATTGNIDNLDFRNASLIRLTGGTTTTIRGLLAGTPGQLVTIVSAAAGNDFLAHQNAGSAAANQILCPFTSIDVPLAAGKGTAMLQYDGTTDRWRVVSFLQGAPIAYTPVWTESGGTTTIGDGSLTGNYIINGIEATARVFLVYGATTTTTSGGFWSFTVPGSFVAGTNYLTFGLSTNAGVANFPAMTTFVTASSFAATSIVAGAAVSATVPFTFAVADNFVGIAKYIIS